MKVLFIKLNEIFDKSNNRLLRFSISFIVILTPFLCVSFLVLIAVHNYLRAAVLILLLINSFFTSTKDNKFVLAFIGLIPLGFYVVTSPVFLGYILGVQALNIGGILWDNKIITLISGASIYGIIKAAKGASSVYEWFLNTGIGGYFFPNYKNLKDQIALKDETIKRLFDEQNALILGIRSIKATIQQLKIDVIGTLNNLTSNQLQQGTNNPIPAPTQASINQIQQLTQTMDNTINNIDNQLNQNQQNTQQIIATQQQSNAMIPVPDSTITVVQKVLTGAAVLIAGDQLTKILGGDGSILVQGFNMAKNTLGPWIIPTGTATAYAVGEVTIRTFDGTTKTIKTLAATTSTVYHDTKALIEKGVNNILENVKNVPNITQNVIKLDIFKPVLPENLKVELLETLKEIEKAQKIPDTTTINPTKGRFRHPIFNVHSTFIKEGIQDVPLIRQSGFRDFLKIKNLSKSKNIPLPVVTSPVINSTTISHEKIKSITWSLPD